jgi:hypothetical protein
MATYSEELSEIASERENSSGGNQQSYPWHLRISDPSAEGGFRTSTYSVPAANQQELYENIGNVALRPEDQGLPVARANMGTERMNVRFPGTDVYPEAAQPQLNISQAVQQGAIAQGGPGAQATTPGGLSTSTTGAPPTIPGQVAPGQADQRQRGGGTWSAPGLTEAFTQEDFYANTGPMVGQYSTGNEYVATPGRLPMAAISKAATILNNRQVELDQKRQAMMEELYKPIKTATPYQQNFNQIVNAEHDKFIKSVADAYTGGNIAKANRLIMSNPELRARWRQQNADLESLGARGQYIFEKAENYLKEAAKGTVLGATPEMRKLANDIILGVGGYGTKDGKGGDFNTLISKINQFETMIDRNEYFKSSVVDMVKNFAERIPVGGRDPETGQPITSPYKIDRDGRYIFFQRGHLDSFKKQAQELALSMAVDQGYGTGNTVREKIADNYRYLINMLGDKYNMDVSMEDTYKGLGGGGGSTSGGGDTAQKYRYGYEKTAAIEKDIQPGKDNYWITVAKDRGANIPTGYAKDAQSRDIPRYVEEISIGGETSGEGRPLKPKYIGEYFFTPTHVFRDANGKLWVRGKDAKEPGVKGVDAEGDLIPWTPEEVGVTDESKGTYAKFERLKDVIIPVAGNEGDIANYLGVPASELNRMIENKIGVSSSSFDDLPD